MRIAVVGAGYVGLVTGACLADTGNDVTLVDVSSERVAQVNRGECPIVEAGLDRLIERGVREDRLRATTDLAQGVRDRRAVFIAVSTQPQNDGSCDLSQVLDVAGKLGGALSAGTVVILKSTAPVGTTAEIGARVARGAEVPFHVASNPEFLKEGTAVSDFLKPDRIIVGAEDEQAFALLEDLYAPFVRTHKPILRMDPASAELSKYASNAYLAMRISFINELALLSEKVGADIESVRRGIGTDPRIGEGFLFPGPGYGGSCFPKDVLAYESMGKAVGLELELARATHRVNERQRRYVLEKTLHALGGDARNRRVALWGLSFKAGTDDCRESAAVFLIDALHERGARILAYDPEAGARNLGSRAALVTLVSQPYEALEGADVLVVLTEWGIFREPDFERMKKAMNGPVIVDARNLYRGERLASLGFRHYGIGGAKR